MKVVDTQKLWILLVSQADWAERTVGQKALKPAAAANANYCPTILYISCTWTGLATGNDIEKNLEISEV